MSKLISQKNIENSYKNYPNKELIKLSDKNFDIILNNIINNKNLYENYDIISKFRDIDRIRQKNKK